MKKTKKKIDPMEEAKLEFLPKSLDLHSMKCDSFELRNDPVEVSYTDGTKQIMRTESNITFKLRDYKNGITAEVTIHKTYYH